MFHTINWSNQKKLMNRNNLTFDTENLVVDYISFNIQVLVDRKQVEIIAKYLFQNLGFNSTFTIKFNGKQKTLFFN